MRELRPRWGPGKTIAHRILVAIVGPSLVTLAAALEPRPHTAIVAVLYVLAVVIAARWGGALAGIGASLLSFLFLNFFFTPPVHTFGVGTAEDLVALFAFLLSSVIVGVLLSSAVSARERAERRELEAHLLNRLATRLLSGDSTDKALAGFADGICEIFGLARCEIVTPFTVATASPSSTDLPGLQREFRLAARGQEIGLMKIWLGRRARLSEDERRVIESLATQLALALEGMRLSVEVRRAELEVHASQLKAALFSGVTHDVKTPLAAITTAVTSLIDGRDFSDQERRDHLETIKQEADRLHRVVNNLLDVARLRAGALVAVKSPSPIDELLESVINRLRPLLQDREVSLRVAEEIPEVPMDVVQIDQVLTNLIENSIKFTPAGSPISLSAVGNPDGVRVTVADSGPGIPREDRVRIFEPFERGGSTTSGTGLGLAIAHAIVAAHGGRMWVSEAPAGGAAFTFELPCASDPSIEAVTDAPASARR